MENRKLAKLLEQHAKDLGAAIEQHDTANREGRALTRAKMVIAKALMLRAAKAIRNGK